MKKAFTLFEVLAVIMILGILIAIIIPSMGAVLKRNKEKLFHENENRIVEAAQNYLIENVSSGPRKVGESIKVSFDTLIERKYLTEIKDLENKNLTCNGYVLTTKLEKTYELLPYLECSKYISGSIPEKGILLNMPLGKKRNNNIFEDITNNYFGTSSNVLNATNRFESQDEASNFNGTTSYIRVENVGELSAKDLTISLWVNAKRTNRKQIVLSNNNSSGSGGYSIELNDNAQGTTPSIYLYGVGSLTSEEDLIYGRWYNIVAVFKDKKEMTIYINGKLKGTAETDKSINYDANTILYIGRGSVGSYFDGLIDDVRIYGRSLSESEILHAYKIEEQINVE